MADQTNIEAPFAAPEMITHRTGVDDQHLRRRWTMLLFFSLTFFFMLTSTGRIRTMDELMTLFESESLVLRGSTAVPQANPPFFFGRFDRYGQRRAAYAPGQALAATPWYALGRFVLAHLPGIPDRARNLTVGCAITLSNSTFAAAAAALPF